MYSMYIFTVGTHTHIYIYIEIYIYRGTYIEAYIYRGIYIEAYIYVSGRSGVKSVAVDSFMLYYLYVIFYVILLCYAMQC